MHRLGVSYDFCSRALAHLYPLECASWGAQSPAAIHQTIPRDVPELNRLPSAGERDYL